ncbi:copper homeostasis protein [Paenibacillus sp. JGP012]|uniref:copper homeostasis protein CutC n=1 Tax=Paenibacillus sp. JGP012 TaxID=2735914 RepID=UPI001613358A|nr:copper homeostasis protein CutC [Paenibacillus sp. JGP012]MBB6022479.1 copper homeostasis protein [Paenibacillus sp. JGP012]
MKKQSKRQPILEVIATDTADARAAEQGGADRIELVAAMTEGGLTPSYGVIEQVVANISIPVYVMIRPHSRSFCYSPDDIRVMTQDVRVARALGAAGIVIGALTTEGKVDRSCLQPCLSEAKGLGVTFHRAIDASSNLPAVLKNLGGIHDASERNVVERVLTSGGKPAAPEGLPELKQLQELGQMLNIAVMAGSGVTIEGISDIVGATGITEIHMGSGVRRVGSFQQPVDAQLVTEAKARLIRAVQQLESL